MVKNLHIVEISHFDKLDLEFVGSKAVKLGELKHLGIPIPEGFVIKNSFFEKFIHESGIGRNIRKTQEKYHPSLKDSVDKLFEPIRKEIIHTHLPKELSSGLHQAYRRLAGQIKETDVNIYSISKTGKPIFFFNIKGDANLVLKIKNIWSQNFDKPIPITVIKSIKTKINGSFDTNAPVINKKLTDQQINRLNHYGNTIQKHYYFPQIVDYSIADGKIIITDIKPFTGEMPISNSGNNAVPVRTIIAKGISINPGIATGRVRVLSNKHEYFKIKKGEIIALSGLDYKELTKVIRASGIILDFILPNSPERILFKKKYHYPAIESVINATKIFKNGNVITINGSNGEIYSGGLVN